MTTKADCDQAIDQFRHSHRYRSEWLLIVWAIACGAIGSSLVLISDMLARMFE